MKRGIYHQPLGPAVTLDVIAGPEKNAEGVLVVTLGRGNEVVLSNAPVHVGDTLPPPGSVSLVEDAASELSAVAESSDAASGPEPSAGAEQPAAPPAKAKGKK